MLATAKEIATQRKLGCADCRPGRLLNHIRAFEPLEFAYYEDVLFAVSRIQAQLWGGWRAIVQLLSPPVKLRAVPVQTLKKFATGSGAATKERMIAALPAEVRAKNPGDDEADAYHLLKFALKELSL